MIAQLVRFGGVGVLITLAHVLVAMAARALWPLTDQQANLAGFAVAVVLSYLGHARVTFQAPVGSVRQVLRFGVLALVSLGASSGTVWLLGGVLGLAFPVAMIAVALVVPVANFLAMRFWVFAGAEDGKGD